MGTVGSGMNEVQGEGLGDFLRNVRKGRENALEIVREALGDGKEKVTIAMQNRELQPEVSPIPRRAESRCRAHHFNDVEGFIAYLQKYGGDEIVVLADMQFQQVSATLDEKAEGGRETILLDMQKHPMWMPWAKQLGEPLKMDDFVQLALENRRQIKADAKQLIVTLSQIRMSSEVTLYAGTGVDAVNGILIKTKVTGGNTEDKPAELPNEILLEVPLFVGTEFREIIVDVTVKPGQPDEAPRVVLTSADAQTKSVEVFAEVLAKIKETLTESVIGLGQITYDRWLYLDD